MNNFKDIEILLNRWQHSIFDYLPKIFLALLVLTAFYFIAKLFRNLSLKFYSKTFKKQSDVVKVISVIVYFFFLLSGIFLALEVLGLESVLTKLLAGAGIVGIVAGFAFKEIASNAFAGFLLNVQRPFKPKEWVEIDNNFGTIKEIGWINTSIRTIEGQKVFIPNQIIYNTTFKNYSTFKKRRIIFKSGVSYGDDLEHVRAVALDEVRKIDSLLKEDAIDFYFTGIGNSTYNFELRFWVHFSNQEDYLKAMSETIIRIKKRFEQENISIAYSVTTLDFGVKGGVNLFDKVIQTNK
ncbi:MAG: mechanosensitive ion channel protein MscS [Ignavibacteriae bacterium]|nr:MAG: mechanosensitive ion channel protein MscS [Ignavibacteriota bacterium]